MAILLDDNQKGKSNFLHTVQRHRRQVLSNYKFVNEKILELPILIFFS
jgi:hypothetical protein